MAAYLEACFEEADGDAAFVARALGDIARATGMSQVAREAGLLRESLYKALSGERSPDFDTILKAHSACDCTRKPSTVDGVMARVDGLLAAADRSAGLENIRFTA